ncbi:hypothetical protein D3C81_1912850 [compost metagenome]
MKRNKNRAHGGGGKYDDEVELPGQSAVQKLGCAENSQIDAGRQSHVDKLAVQIRLPAYNQIQLLRKNRHQHSVPKGGQILPVPAPDVHTVKFFRIPHPIVSRISVAKLGLLTYLLLFTYSTKPL